VPDEDTSLVVFGGETADGTLLCDTHIYGYGWLAGCTFWGCMLIENIQARKPGHLQSQEDTFQELGTATAL
jgi:hypothetical protein